MYSLYALFLKLLSEHTRNHTHTRTHTHSRRTKAVDKDDTSPFFFAWS